MNIKHLLAVAILSASLVPNAIFAKGARGGGKKAAGQTAAEKQDAANEKAVTAASDEVQKDKDALDAITAKLRPTFEASPDYVAAVAAQNKAQADYNTANAAFIADLMTHQDYKDAVAAKAAAQAKVDDLRKDPNNAPDVMTSTAKEALDAANNVTRLQNDAMEGNSQLTSLKATAAAAADKVAGMKKDFQTKLTSDPTWAAAKTTLDQAQAKLDAARSKLG